MWNFNSGSNSASEHARDMVLVAKPMFWGMENHLGPFSEASDQPEGQELGGGAVGGQEVLRPLHTVLGLQVDLRLLKLIPNDSPCPKTWGLTPKPCL